MKFLAGHGRCEWAGGRVGLNHGIDNMGDTDNVGGQWGRSGTVRIPVDSDR